MRKAWFLQAIIVASVLLRLYHAARRDSRLLGIKTAVWF
jgi:hypothetical protein